jgi:ankyrin repeat protein
VALLSLLPKRQSFKTVEATPPEFPNWVHTAMFGTAAALRDLLDAGLDPNAATVRGTSPLMMSAHDSEKVALLLKRGAQVSAKAGDGTTVLHIAAGMTGDTNAFRRLLDAGADVNGTTANGASVLGMAVTGEPERVALLLARGADANRPFTHGGAGMTYPLQLAVGGGAREIAQLLVSHRAGPGDHTRVGFGALPPLSQAVKNGQLPMVALLISTGADVNQRDDLGMTPLLWSSLSDFGSTSVSEALLVSRRRGPCGGRQPQFHCPAVG